MDSTDTRDVGRRMDGMDSLSAIANVIGPKLTRADKPPMPPTRLAVPIAGLLMSLLSGCGYMIGSAYQPEILTIHVPTFTSNTFRRGVEFQLTDAVQKEIQNRSHFRLVKGPYADTRLSGNVVAARKLVLGESGFDDPRELQLSMAVEVTWEDLRTGEILAQRRIPLQAESVELMATASFAPEVGQSLATGTQLTVDRLARQIVEMMEMPW